MKHIISILLLLLSQALHAEFELYKIDFDKKGKALIFLDYLDKKSNTKKFYFKQLGDTIGNYRIIKVDKEAVTLENIKSTKTIILRKKEK